MLKKIVFMAITFLFICCNNKNKSSKMIDNNEVVKNQKKEEKPEIVDKKNEELKLSEWELLDKNVFDNIDEIKKSNSSNRKVLLHEFTTFSNKTDGATSEGYFSFAFDYPKNNFQDFFSVLNKQDSVLVDNWAKSASMELKLIMDNIDEPDAFLSEFIYDFQNKINKTDSEKKKLLAELYLNSLTKYSKNK